MDEITSRADIERLVNAFYDRVRHDDVIGPIFDDVAQVDWSAHLPRMYDFWESILLGSVAFKGNPMAVHRALARRTPLTSVQFARWIVLFHETVDSLFTGACAADAKDRAVRIAMTMQHHIAADAGGVLRL